MDSTNVVNPELSIITTISKDHCSILGNEIESIAEEKAGIVKKGKPVKILGRGKIDSPVNITANKFSATAEKLIEKAGGKITKI